MAALPTSVLFSAVLLAAPALQDSPLSVPASGAEGESRIEIPFEMSPRGHIVVQAAVDGGEPVPFVVDTGAGITILNRARLSSFDLTERSSDEVAQRAHGAVSLGWTDVELLSVGQAAFEGLDVGVLDLTDVEAGQMEIYGILGFDVLSRYDVSLDFSGRTVDLYPRAEDVANCQVCEGALSTSFDLAAGTHIQFDVSISDQSIRTVLDTGSGRNAMNRRAAAAIGVDLPEPMPGAHAPGLSVGAIQLGGETLAQEVPVGVMDLSAFEALGMANGPALLIGTEVLAGRRVGISYGLNRLSIR